MKELYNSTHGGIDLASPRPPPPSAPPSASPQAPDAPSPPPPAAPWTSYPCLDFCYGTTWSTHGWEDKCKARHFCGGCPQCAQWQPPPPLPTAPPPPQIPPPWWSGDYKGLGLPFQLNQLMQSNQSSTLSDVNPLPTDVNDWELPHLNFDGILSYQFTYGACTRRSGNSYELGKPEPVTTCQKNRVPRCETKEVEPINPGQPVCAARWSKAQTRCCGTRGSYDETALYDHQPIVRVDQLDDRPPPPRIVNGTFGLYKEARTSIDGTRMGLSKHVSGLHWEIAPSFEPTRTSQRSILTRPLQVHCHGPTFVHPKRVASTVL